MSVAVISADSHITEPPDCYTKYIDAKYRDVAPVMKFKEGLGDVYVIDGMATPIPMGLVAAAGLDPKSLAMEGTLFKDLWKGGWNSKYRIADQDKDGVAAEIIYPTVGMVMCNHPDFAYKRACMKAYNHWLLEYCDEDRTRLIPLAQIAMGSINEGIEDLKEIKAQGFPGVMMPGNPGELDYDSPAYDAFWQLAIELELPLSFHILTGSADTLGEDSRGPRINAFQSIIRGCQDIMGMLIFSGVFERNPDLKICCVEADAGWVPHYMYRMDHAYKRHRYWMKGQNLEKLPSEYFKENIYITFQDDWVAFQVIDMLNPKRLMWANDFPHSDSTWPWSKELLAKHTVHLTSEQKDDVLHNNVADLYKLSV
ncbi:MAG: amidohydrolase [Pseudomonadales bacterium]|nr:amidohydrolase [Pseudomonadales bacterium]